MRPGYCYSGIRRAAVDGDGLAGDEIAVGGSEEGDRAHQVFRALHALQRAGRCRRLRELGRERTTELAARAGDQDPAASRSDRMGDVVLQRSTTRGSFHGS